MQAQGNKYIYFLLPFSIFRNYIVLSRILANIGFCSEKSRPIYIILLTLLLRISTELIENIFIDSKKSKIKLKYSFVFAISWKRTFLVIKFQNSQQTHIARLSTFYLFAQLFTLLTFCTTGCKNTSQP